MWRIYAAYRHLAGALAPFPNAWLPCERIMNCRNEKYGEHLLGQTAS